jgi:hypothetical protein
MKYMLLIYGAMDQGPAEGSPEAEAEMGRWFAFTQELRESGAWLGGEALHPGGAATTVRERDGQRSITDGPFAETKEILGGYYVIDVPDLDAAVEWAAKLPNVTYGSVEIRPVMEFPEQ